jgi:hypothetical protein
MRLASRPLWRGAWPILRRSRSKQLLPWKQAAPKWRTGQIERPKGKIGEPIWREPGEVHDLRNVGKALYRDILIEIKA